MVNQYVFFPPIFRAIIARVNTYFSTLAANPFIVSSHVGLYTQVGNDIKDGDVKGKVLVWLVMPYVENRRNMGYASVIKPMIVLLTDTEANAKQTNRESDTFQALLIPVLNQILYQITQEDTLDNNNYNQHFAELLPFYGGGVVAGTSVPNIWNQYYDTLKISEIELKIKPNNCPVGLTILN